MPIESLEKEELNEYVQKNFCVKYFRDTEIPDCPRMTKEKLFDYTDKSIPKIINLKKYYDANETNDKPPELDPKVLESILLQVQNKNLPPEKMAHLLQVLKEYTSKNNIINLNKEIPIQVAPIEDKSILLNPVNNLNNINSSGPLLQNLPPNIYPIPQKPTYEPNLPPVNLSFPPIPNDDNLMRKSKFILK